MGWNGRGIRKGTRRAERVVKRIPQFATKTPYYFYQNIIMLRGKPPLFKMCWPEKANVPLTKKSTLRGWSNARNWEAEAYEHPYVKSLTPLNSTWHNSSLFGALLHRDLVVNLKTCSYVLNGNMTQKSFFEREKKGRDRHSKPVADRRPVLLMIAPLFANQEKDFLARFLS